MCQVAIRPLTGVETDIDCADIAFVRHVARQQDHVVPVADLDGAGACGCRATVPEVVNLMVVDDAVRADHDWILQHAVRPRPARPIKVAVIPDILKIVVSDVAVDLQRVARGVIPPHFVKIGVQNCRHLGNLRKVYVAEYEILHIALQRLGKSIVGIEPVASHPVCGGLCDSDGLARSNPATGPDAREDIDERRADVGPKERTLVGQDKNATLHLLPAHDLACGL